MNKISTKRNPVEFAAYVDNIVNRYRSATADQLAKGHAWYPVAHDLAVMVGNGDATTGAGVIAALSANKGWSENVRLAVDAGNGDVHGHTGSNLDKVRAILRGIAPANVLPMSAKTGNFFLNILDPTDASAVTIDRHAHDIAVGEVFGNTDRGLSNPNRYAILRDAYIEAARILGQLPSAVQAVTWCTQIDRLAGVGTRGNRSVS
jgi:hypothetical protein